MDSNQTQRQRGAQRGLGKQQHDDHDALTYFNQSVQLSGKRANIQVIIIIIMLIFHSIVCVYVCTYTHVCYE